MSRPVAAFSHAGFRNGCAVRFSGSRQTPGFNVNVGLPLRGRTEIIRAAKDPVKIPEEPEIVDLVERSLCRVSLGEDCYVVTGVAGGQRIVRYGAPFGDWTRVCNELLDEAMKEGMV
jgi:hypothetical protein